jgi:ribonuclease HI
VGVTDDASGAVVEIFTDGACVPNPGPGGWGALLRYGEHEKQLCGGQVESTTNNRMELTAPTEALNALTRPARVHLYTDSTYVRNGVTAWLAKWKRNGWQTGARQPVKNEDLWRALDAATSRHQVEWHWVKGHAGHPGNEAADRLAAQGLGDALRAAGLALPAAATRSVARPRRPGTPRRRIRNG